MMNPAKAWNDWWRGVSTSANDKHMQVAFVAGYTVAQRDAVAMLRALAQTCDCFAREPGECGCGAWDTDPGERSYKRNYVEDMADMIEFGEVR